MLFNDKYLFSTAVRDNDILRRSFNKLTKDTFKFDFTEWYERGHWGNLYLPHVMLDKDKVVSNISVNWMTFDINGQKKKYLQLGTVMTDKDYRGQGLNRLLMEHILQGYDGDADGFYLFANNSVLDYYPKFGFRPMKEYEYYLPVDFNHDKDIHPYQLEHVNLEQKEQYDRLYQVINAQSTESEDNQNDGMYMHNTGLFQFWLDIECGDQVYYIPESDTYIVAECKNNVLHVIQVFGNNKVDIKRLARSFDDVSELTLGYTPVHKDKLLVREHKKKNSTLYVIGNDLDRMENDKMMFAEMSHA